MKIQLSSVEQPWFGSQVVDWERKTCLGQFLNLLPVMVYIRLAQGVALLGGMEVCHCVGGLSDHPPNCLRESVFS